MLYGDIYSWFPQSRDNNAFLYAMDFKMATPDNDWSQLQVRAVLHFFVCVHHRKESGSNAFRNLKTYDEVVMPTHRKESGSNAFRNLKTYDEVVMSTHRKESGSNAFRNLKTYDEVVMSTHRKESGSNAFRNLKTYDEVVTSKLKVSQWCS